ncbi:Major basic nuclear protein 2 [Symbiodinium microadriaticum]|uniref:Major basic nuclear protein 2 n=1 Tax=Symbiodinium microadriaticum TaxID=2951 RepID=A0A1Q9D940_SYMMI|nr:Major basic nuclear protein 2 [Symbiodinium microadriaticum]
MCFTASQPRPASYAHAHNAAIWAELGRGGIARADVAHVPNVAAAFGGLGLNSAVRTAPAAFWAAHVAAGDKRSPAFADACTRLLATDGGGAPSLRSAVGACELLQELTFVAKSLGLTGEMPRGSPMPWKPYTAFATLADCLWLLWESALCGEPLMIFSPDYPTKVAEAVLAVASLISPVEYSGDFRPYFTIYDGDFEHYRQHVQSNGASSKAVVFGVTNPVMLQLLADFPISVLLQPRHREDASTQSTLPAPAASQEVLVESPTGAMKTMKSMKAMKAVRAAPKGEIAGQLADSAGLKKSEVMQLLDALADIGTKELKKAGKFTLPGLVMIKTRKKKATKAGKRMMFGKEVKVKAQPAKTVVKAFPVKAVKAMKTMKSMKAMKAVRAAPKGEIAGQLADSAGLKKSEVMQLLDALADIGTKELKKAGKFTLPGLVMIKTRKKKATKAGKRMMFGKEVKVKAQPAKTVVKAFPVKAVKDRLQRARRVPGSGRGYAQPELPQTGLGVLDADAELLQRIKASDCVDQDDTVLRYFYELTLAFLRPFLPHLEALTTGAAGGATFDVSSFLASLQPVGPFSQISRNDCQNLYSRFIRGVNFKPWLAKQVSTFPRRCEDASPADAVMAGHAMDSGVGENDRTFSDHPGLGDSSPSESTALQKKSHPCSCGFCALELPWAFPAP